MRKKKCPQLIGAALCVLTCSTFHLLSGDEILSGDETVQLNHRPYLFYKVIPDFQLGPPDIAVYHINAHKPIHLSDWARLYDRNIYYFDNGTLTVSFELNGTSDDRLVILEDYSLKTHDAVIEKNLLLNGNKIGTYQGGVGLEPLVITFNYFADHGAIETVLSHIGYVNVAKNPSLAVRKVSFILTNGSGGVSREVTKSIMMQE